MSSPRKRHPIATAERDVATLRGRKPRLRERIEAAHRAHAEARIGRQERLGAEADTAARAANAAVGLKDAAAAVADQLAEAERRIAEMKDRAARATESETVRGAVGDAEQAAAQLGKAIERVRQALIAIGTFEASETAGAICAFHGDFSRAIGTVIAERRAYATAVQGGTAPIRWAAQSRLVAAKRAAVERM